MRALRFILPLLLVFALIWIGIWWYAQSQLVVGFQREEAKLREAGWTITHGPITRGSSPLAASATVPNLKLTLPGAPGTRPTIDLPSFNERIDATSPFTVAMNLPHHFTVHAANGTQIAIDADLIEDNLYISGHDFMPNAKRVLIGGSVRINNLRASVANSNFPIVTIGAIRTHMRLNQDADATETAVRLNESFSNIAVSPMFVTLIHLPFNGEIEKYTTALTVSGPDLKPILTGQIAAPVTANSDPNTAFAHQLAAIGALLRPWASHGGHGTLAVGLIIGPLNAKIDTAFTFDHALQPEGTGTVSATGLHAFFADIATAQPRFANGLAAATAATAPYMVKGADGHQKLSIALALKNRSLSLNGKPTTTFPLVNWPPAASAPSK
ncbi:hypothetical protein ACOSOMT5_P2510 [Acidiphilium sp. MT5]